MLKHVSCSAKRALQVFFFPFFLGAGGEGVWEGATFQ